MSLTAQRINTEPKIFVRDDNVSMESKLDEHTPNSFVVEKEVRNYRQGLITERGLENEVVTLLEERAMLSAVELNICLAEDGQLYSRDFPTTPLTELYSAHTGDPIYDLRSPYDTEYISKIERWANESMGRGEPLSWIRFSPTTGGMSKETKVEIGMQNLDDLQVLILTIPFREGQNNREVLREIKKLASSFDPHFNSAQSEFDFLPKPLRLEDLEYANPWVFENLSENGVVKRARVIRFIDSLMTDITGVQYFMGKESYKYDSEEGHNFGRVVERLYKEGLINDYIKACKKGDIYSANRKFNKIVNNFDNLWQKRETFTAKSKFMDFEIIENDSAPVFLASGCGAVGGGKVKLSGVNLSHYKKALERLGIKLTENMNDPVECPSCSSIFFVDNNNPQTYFSSCPFCGSQKITCH